jgi:hypothetical protein
LNLLFLNEKFSDELINCLLLPKKILFTKKLAEQLRKISCSKILLFFLSSLWLVAFLIRNQYLKRVIITKKLIILAFSESLVNNGIEFSGKKLIRISLKNKDIFGINWSTLR